MARLFCFVLLLVIGHSAEAQTNSAATTVEGVNLERYCADRCRATPACSNYQFNAATKNCTLTIGDNKLSSLQVTWSGDTPECFLSSPCINSGVCLQTLYLSGPQTACTCPPQWSGDTCAAASAQPVWSDWSALSSCSASCGEGMQSQTRTCSIAGGCDGGEQRYQACTVDACAGLSAWAAWSVCVSNSGCGRGSQSRTRTTTAGLGQVVGELVQSRPCVVAGCDPMEAPVKILGATAASGSVTLLDALSRRFEPVCGSSGWTAQTADIVCKQIGLTGVNAATTLSAIPASARRMAISHCSASDAAIQLCSLQWVPVGTNCTAAASLTCKVDGGWSAWTPWSTCSVTCASGINTRQRACLRPAATNGGVACAASGANEQRPCTLPNCPVDGYYSAWTTWTSCPVTCGGAERSRVRTCTPPQYGGHECDGAASEHEACNTDHCPVDGAWVQWSTWSVCSTSCGNGTRDRNRTCVGPFYEGHPCDGSSVQTVDCENPICPIDGVWNTWSDWFACSVTCGSGTKLRSRGCHGPFYGGHNCSGATTDSADCFPVSCPVNGYWLAWSGWTSCDLQCGGGSQGRTRECHQPLYGGDDCPGDGSETQACNTQNCPVDGYWQSWSAWASCTVSCGGGSQGRSRECVQPLYGGETCPGVADESQACSTDHCPVDGYWQDWSAWTQCSTSCAAGTQDRQRECHAPQYGGADCSGASTGTQACDLGPCPVDGYWHDWSQWQVCSVSCSDGTTHRSRTCEPPRYNGANCDGSSADSKACNEGPCPINGTWQAWSSWSTCPVTCGGAVTQRARDCNQPQYGGAPCPGNANETMSCNTSPCPVDGVWVSWSTWAACNVTCGGGTRSRSRTCTGPFYGGLACAGALQEAETCNTQFCPYPRTCTEIKGRGTTASGYYYVDPWSPYDGSKKFRVYCNMTDAQGMTLLGSVDHSTDLQITPGNDGFPYLPSDGIDIIYNNTLNNMLLVINNSATCRQMIRWKCWQARIRMPAEDAANYQNNLDDTTVLDPVAKKRYTFWENRDHKYRSYWGGVPTTFDGCPCGLNTTNCTDAARASGLCWSQCKNPLYTCNCDSKSPSWQVDEGYITNKDDLPIMAFHAGDLREGEGPNVEKGYYYVGPVECSGTHAWP